VYLEVYVVGYESLLSVGEEGVLGSKSRSGMRLSEV